jgi:TonB family protein
MRRRLPGPIIFLLVLPVLATSAAEAPSVPTVLGYQAPQLAREKVPDLPWPGDPDREALVILEFNVSADGRVSDVQLAEGGFHEQRFVDSATRFLRKARFNPATLSGVAVESLGVRMPFRYQLGAKGITKDFRSELAKVAQFIDRGDYAGAHFHAQWMLSEKVTLNYEYAVLQAQLAQTHARVGNVHRAIVAARAATARATSQIQTFKLRQPMPKNDAGNYLLPKELVASLLDLRLRLTASKGLLLEALQAYYELAGLVEMTPDDPRVAAADKFIQALEGDQPLVGQARIDESGLWAHELFRREFSVGNVQGKVDKVVLHCVGRSRELPYKADAAWKIPASWGGCRAITSGEPGTEFSIIEYQPEKVSAP